jgi:hypothetical protein
VCGVVVRETITNFVSLKSNLTSVRMKVVVVTLLVIVAIVIAAFGFAIAFGGPGEPPPMASINDPFNEVDFSDLPAPGHFTARDGAQPVFRVDHCLGAAHPADALRHVLPRAAAVLVQPLRRVRFWKLRCARRLPPTAYRLRPTAYGLPPTAYRLRPTAYGLPPTAYGLPELHDLVLRAEYNFNRLTTSDDFDHEFFGGGAMLLRVPKDAGGAKITTAS